VTATRSPFDRGVTFFDAAEAYGPHEVDESSTIRNETVEVKEGHVDQADLKVTADSRAPGWAL